MQTNTPIAIQPHYATEESEEEEPVAVDWNLGRFCAARAQAL
jgi:hypothetical protein